MRNFDFDEVLAKTFLCTLCVLCVCGAALSVAGTVWCVNKLHDSWNEPGICIDPE